MRWVPSKNISAALSNSWTGRCRDVYGCGPSMRYVERGPAVITAVVQEKGGVGKTTTAINLGAWLGKLGYRTLLIDADPQGNVAKGLGVAASPGLMYRVMRDPAFPLTDAIVASGVPNVDIVPSDPGLEAAEVEMIQVLSRETVLKRKVEG